MDAVPRNDKLENEIRKFYRRLSLREDHHLD